MNSSHLNLKASRFPPGEVCARRISNPQVVFRLQRLHLQFVPSLPLHGPDPTRKMRSRCQTLQRAVPQDAT